METRLQDEIDKVIRGWSESDVAKLATSLCGENRPHYRRLRDLRDLLGDGDLVSEGYAPSRKEFATDRLKELSKEPSTVKNIIEKSVNPRSFRSEPEKAQSALVDMNGFLAPDGLTIALVNGNPEIVFVGFEEAVESKEKTYSITIDGLMGNPVLRTHVQDRFDQAVLSYEVGASLAAIIMLGSGLEGLLIGFGVENYKSATMQASLPVDKNGKAKSIEDLTLHELILFAHKVGWIESDVKDFANLLRDYRNLVHPIKQIRGNYAQVNSGTMNMSFPIIQQVVADLTAALVTVSQ